MFIARGLKSQKSQNIPSPAWYASSPESPPIAPTAPTSSAAPELAHLNVDILRSPPPAQPRSVFFPVGTQVKRRAYFHATHHQLVEMLKKHIASDKFNLYIQDLRRTFSKAKTSTELPDASGQQTDKGGR